MVLRYISLVLVAAMMLVGLLPTTVWGQDTAVPEIQARTVVTEEAVPESLVAKASYILGFNTARRLIGDLESQGVEVDREQLSKGIQDMASGQKYPFTDEESRTILQAFQQQVQKKQMDKMEKAAQENRESGDAFREANAAKPGVEVLDSGLQYEVLVEGEGDLPATTDTVMVDYKGMFTDGTVFDTSLVDKPGRPAQAVPMAVSGVGTIKGFGIVLPKMKIGSKWRVCIPPELAYQVSGVGPIGPNETLVFEIEVLEVAAEPAE